MNRCRWVIVLALLARSVAFAQSAQPEASNEARQEAAERFERGVDLFREQAFRAALVEFQKAYELAPDFRLLYNLAGAKHQLHDYLGAAQNYEAYLAQGGSDVPPERRAQVEDMLSALRARVGRIEVTINRAGAEVFVDDVKVGVAPLAQLVLANVGRHRVSARSSDGAMGAAFVDVAGGDIAEVSVELDEIQVAKAAIPDAASVERDEPWSLVRRTGFGTWLAGGALLATAVATGTYSLKATADYKRDLVTVPVRRDQLDEQRMRADRLSLSTDLLIGVGAAAVVGGTVLWLMSPERRERARSTAKERAGLRLNLGMKSLGLSGTF